MLEDRENQEQRLPEQQSEAPRGEIRHSHPLTQAMNDVREIMNQVDGLRIRLEQIMSQLTESISRNKQPTTVQETRDPRFLNFETRMAQRIKYARKYADDFTVEGSKYLQYG